MAGTPASGTNEELGADIKWEDREENGEEVEVGEAPLDRVKMPLSQQAGEHSCLEQCYQKCT